MEVEREAEQVEMGKIWGKRGYNFNCGNIIPLKRQLRCYVEQDRQTCRRHSAMNSLNRGLSGDGGNQSWYEARIGDRHIMI